MDSSSPKIIDLFAGAGGLTLGATRAGFDVISAVELDNKAIETHNRNFPNTIHLQKDISKLSGEELLTFSNLKIGELDGIVGGPPCQGFSTMGKREIGDYRNTLFSHFFRLVSETNPTFFIAENVTGILDEKYNKIRNRAFDFLKKRYHILKPIVVKANDFGAPTVRTRIFFIGYNMRKILKEPKENDFVPSLSTKKIVVRDALRGLPLNVEPKGLKEDYGWEKIDKRTFGKNSFFERLKGVIPFGVGSPALLERYFEKSEVSGCIGTKHSPEVESRYASLDIGEQDPISKSVKLDPLGFCPTLRAGTGRDKGSFQAVRPIHFLSPRVITPREAARLQGFPDWFVFDKTKWHSFRQIGNSVSPLVAEQILSILKEHL